MTDEIQVEDYVQLRETYDGRPLLQQVSNRTLFEYVLRYSVVYALSEKAARRIQADWRQKQKAGES